MRSPRRSASETRRDTEPPAERTFKKGDRVEVTKWSPHPTGRVTNAFRGSVFVKYDNSFVEDELDPSDVRPVDIEDRPR